MRNKKDSCMELIRKGFVKGEKELDIIKSKSPLSYMIFWNLLVFGALIAFVSVMFMEYQRTRVFPFEIEGNCNTGFIGIDYKSTFDNQPYDYYWKDIVGDPHKSIAYYVKYIPKELNLKNIDGLNCNFKVKGAIPYNLLREVNWQNVK